MIDFHTGELVIYLPEDRKAVYLGRVTHPCTDQDRYVRMTIINVSDDQTRKDIMNYPHFTVDREEHPVIHIAKIRDAYRLLFPHLPGDPSDSAQDQNLEIPE